MDLVEEAKKHLTFLQEIHKTGVTITLAKQSPSCGCSSESVRRYQDLWLPLVAAHCDQDQKLLIPPADVAWIWHCHRLSPISYERYMQSRFGQMLEATPPFSFQWRPNHKADISEEDTAAADTRAISNHSNSIQVVYPLSNTDDILVDAIATNTRNLWAMSYPNEDFDLQPKRFLTSPLPKFEFIQGFDILASATSQKDFWWQVSRPQYTCDTFLKDGVERYYKFLRIPNLRLALVPTYQIDLIWHTHILSSSRLYKHDCMVIRGQPFFHDDSFGNGDRSPGQSLDVAFRETCQQWMAMYGTDDYANIPGTLYAGEPPKEYYEQYATWVPPAAASATPKCVPETNTVAMPAENDNPQQQHDQMANLGVLEEKKVENEPATDNTNNLTSSSAVCWKIPSESDNTFVPPMTLGRTNNPGMAGYTFGHGPLGVGYYSLDTREGYECLLSRLGEQETVLKTSHLGTGCSFLCCLDQATVDQRDQSHRDAMSKLKAQQRLVTARLYTKGPGYFVEDPNNLSADSSREKRFTDKQLHVSEQHHFTDKELCQAAGCGGYAPAKRVTRYAHACLIVLL